MQLELFQIEEKVEREALMVLVGEHKYNLALRTRAARAAAASAPRGKRSSPKAAAECFYWVFVAAHGGGHCRAMLLCDGVMVTRERYDAIARPAITPLAKEQDDRDDIGADVALSEGVVASTSLKSTSNS